MELNEFNDSLESNNPQLVIYFNYFEVVQMEDVKEKASSRLNTLKPNCK